MGLLSGGIFYLLTTRNVNFGGILADENTEGIQALSNVLERYNQKVSRASLFTELRNVCDACEFQDVFNKHGYYYEPHLNYFLDLERTSDEILSSFGKQTRRKIRTNMKTGAVVVREINDREMVSVFYDIIQKTYSHARIPLADISLFEAAFDVLMPKQMVRFSIAYVEDAPASAIVCLLYKDVMFGWYMGIDRSYGKFYPNEIIVWDAMKWGAEHGYAIMDFGGGGKPEEDSSVRDFKLKFHGDLCELGRNRCIHAPFRRKLCEPMYEFSRKLLQLMGLISKDRVA